MDYPTLLVGIKNKFFPNARVSKKVSKKTDTSSAHSNAEGERFPHDAFICYSRKNEEFAVLLELFTEEYKPPRSLEVPQRHLDLFRDKRDFAAGDYNAARDEHLMNSKKLIVICSPEARGSAYVNDEIASFAELRDAKNIIPILLSGIPNNEVSPGREGEMAFPEALCKVMVMPLAVNYLGFDVKKNSLDRGIFADSWFALLASIYDKSRSEIEQREKRRRARVRKITFSILVGSIIILSSLLFLVWLSRNEAFDRKLAAEAAQSDALASQMFSESRRTDAQIELEQQRLSELREEFDKAELENQGQKNLAAIRLTSLAQEIEQTRQEIKTLESRSKEHRQKGKEFLSVADDKWSAVQGKRKDWVTERSRPSVPTIFSLELLNASDEGKCMILHYGDADSPEFIIIGGGLFRNYSTVLQPRLQQIKDKWAPSTALPIEIVIACEMDVQSIGGLIAMTDSLVKEKELNKPSIINITTIWYNSFQPQPEGWQKARLPLNAQKLNIPQNVPFDHLVMRPDSGAVTTTDGPLNITVIHPYLRRIEDLATYWASTARRLVDTTFDERIPKEEFTSKALKITGSSPVLLDSSVFQGYRDRSVTNLASICVVFEIMNQRILFTGDAVGDDILKGLHAAGYLSDKGTTHMDVLILPHSASNHNVSKDFFTRVTADHYVLLGDGTHNNPEVATLEMLERARAADQMSMYFVNRDGRNNHGNKLDKYFLDNVRWAKPHRRVFRKSNNQNLIINVLDPVRY